MNAHDVAILVLLLIGTISTIICCAGLVLMKDFYERLHYMATAATVSMFAYTVAVLLKEGWGQAGIKTIFVGCILVIMNAVLTHATARAARVRQFGYWTPRAEEHVGGSKASAGSKQDG